MAVANEVLLVLAFCTILTSGLQLGRSGSKETSQACWEYLWIGHANSSILGQGALKDLSNYADSAGAFSGRGNFAFYVDTEQGVDVGYVKRDASGQPKSKRANAMESEGSDAPSASSSTSLVQNLNAKLTSTQHFPSLVDTGFPTLIQAATKQMDLSDSSCPRVVSYSGHGYNFNGIGYQDHHFLPWQSFFGALTDAFGGPVDLLALDTCRMATYMMLNELASAGAAKYVLAQQDTSVYLHGYGSWSFETLPFSTATDVKSFGSKLLEDSMDKMKEAETKGLVFIDMEKFRDFSVSFKKLTSFLQDHMSDMLPLVSQARRSSLELRGPSLYEPDSAGMLVDLGSFLSHLKDATSAGTSSFADETVKLIGDAEEKRQAAIMEEKHDDSDELTGVSGLSLWFMKPEAGGMHKELLQHVRDRLQTGGGHWAEFLSSYYAEAEHTKLSEDDMHAVRTLQSPLP